MLDVRSLRRDFPLLQKYPGLIYFDNACMSLKPWQVLKEMEEYYTRYSGCHGRSAHWLSRKTTERYEKAREKVARFIGADTKEVVFTRNTTEGINLLATQVIFKSQVSNLKEKRSKPSVIISDKEHNSNLIPWLRLLKRGRLELRVLKTDAAGGINLKQLETILQQVQTERSAVEEGWGNLVSLHHTSNLDGVTIPAKEVIELAHRYGFWVHLDAAQSAPHLPLDVKKLGVDFLTFSGHKMLAPTGTGVFYARKELLEEMEPLVPGGGTIIGASLEDFEYLTAPERFEGGLQNYAGIIGLGAAIDYLQQVGLEEIHWHERQLNARLRDALSSMKRVRLISPTDALGSITTFTVEGLDAREVALLLDKTAKVMVRSGQFCVHSWFAKRKIKAAVRVSLYLYNTGEEVDRFVKALKEIIRLTS